ncbi:hypothetical protein QJS10_CPB19g01820 [Acorus calamus]|uniref:Uncharacterized protein n=1 Tax=Acorus calamus TaxID=4465 RepID=A0AAV9CGY7_ACOCL|nr:hypothetical protein QJS10_CPB19g01820 [Acorus calamus]
MWMRKLIDLPVRRPWRYRRLVMDGEECQHRRLFDVWRTMWSRRSGHCQEKSHIFYVVSKCSEDYTKPMGTGSVHTFETLYKVPSSNKS